jgi:hypothetical protein
VRTRQNAREVGFRLEVIYADADLNEIRVSAWNGAFGGATDIYIQIDGLVEVAAKLAGFPRDPSDVREFILGAFGHEFAGGAVSMKFYCIDQAGHAFVESRIESGAESAGVWQAATLVMPVEAAAIDRFVEDLRRVEKEKSGVAVLESRG